MHRSTRELLKYHIRASDGEIGRCKDFLFDDQAWVIRYLVADTRKWLPGRKVLVPPQSLKKPHVENRLLPVEHTKEEIRQSPPLDADEPVSRKYEKKWFDYYRLPYYWVGPTGVGIVPNPVPLRDSPVPLEEEVTPRPLPSEKEIEKTHLRSADEVIGYQVEAIDGHIGHVEDLLVEDADWRIAYLLIDTRDWLPGKKVVMLPDLAEEISWPKETVQFDRSKEEMENAPPYNPELELTSAYEKALEQYYGIPPHNE